MKLAFCYTIFDGLDLLELSIAFHQGLSDEIILCHQPVSNTGRKPTQLYQFLNHIKGKRGITLIEYIPDLKVSTKENERRKHNLMIATARNFGCTHFVMSAADHFYPPDQFLRVKNDCILYDYDVTFTGMYTYYKEVTWQLTPVENYYMPFVCKLYPDTQVSTISPKDYPVLVDPSVRVNTYRRYKIYHSDDVMMHHYSMVRVNIWEKFANSASKFSQSQIEDYTDEYLFYDIASNPGIKYFQGRKIKIVESLF